MVTDFSAYPLQRIPSLVHPSLRFRKRNDQFYVRPMYISLSVIFRYLLESYFYQWYLLYITYKIVSLIKVWFSQVCGYLFRCIHRRWYTCWNHGYKWYTVVSHWYKWWQIGTLTYPWITTTIVFTRHVCGWNGAHGWQALAHESHDQRLATQTRLCSSKFSEMAKLPPRRAKPEAKYRDGHERDGFESNSTHDCQRSSVATVAHDDCHDPSFGTRFDGL